MERETGQSLTDGPKDGVDRLAAIEAELGEHRALLTRLRTALQGAAAVLDVDHWPSLPT